MFITRVIILLVILNSISIIAVCQDKYHQVIRGVVKGKSTFLPLPGANVTLLNSEPFRGTVTDEKGWFALDKVPVGRQGIRISFIGYKDQVFENLILTTGKELILEIQPS